MLSKKEGRNYVILDEGQKFPVKLNKKATDTLLENLASSLKNVSDILRTIYQTNYDLYDLVNRNIFYRACLDVDEGDNWNIRYASDECKELLEQLQLHQDEIPAEEELVTLDDLGYRADICSCNFWEKIIEDTEEQEVVEEVVWDAEYNWRHRLRTTIWEKTDYGKHSKSITYKTLRTTKYLKCAIENTIRDVKAKKASKQGGE